MPRAGLPCPGCLHDQTEAVDRRAGSAEASTRGAVAALWATLGGPAPAVDRLRIESGGTGLDSPLPVSDLALGSVGAAALAAAELAVQRGASAGAESAIDSAGVGAAFISE